jgi:hypothetical protein
MTKTPNVDNTRALDLIEREWAMEPNCVCGRWTEPVSRDGAVWLECSTLSAPPTGWSRLLTTITGRMHTRRPVVELCLAA